MEEMTILQPHHKELISLFEKASLPEDAPLSLQMKTWDARWREESLDHYLSLGWSFGVFKEGELSAYILAQPFVFFRGMTQTLWVEWLGAINQAEADRVIDVAYRWARDKHFQKVATDSEQSFSSYIRESSFNFELDEGLMTLKTSKIRS